MNTYSSQSGHPAADQLRMVKPEGECCHTGHYGDPSPDREPPPSRLTPSPWQHPNGSQPSLSSAQAVSPFPPAPGHQSKHIRGASYRGLVQSIFSPPSRPPKPSPRTSGFLRPRRRAKNALHYLDSCIIRSECETDTPGRDGSGVSGTLTPDKASQTFEEREQFRRWPPFSRRRGVESGSPPECLQHVALHLKIGRNVSACGGHRCMAEVISYHRNIDPCLQKGNGTTVPHDVWSDSALS